MALKGAVQKWAGGSVGISSIRESWVEARGPRPFHPLGKWWKCQDCPDASPSRKAMLTHMELHRRAGDYDLPDDEDGNDGEYDSSSENPGRDGAGGGADHERD
jgi:hypothetical protein